MANNRNDDAPDDERQDFRDKAPEDDGDAQAQGLERPSLITKKPGIKPS
jgi:hypothetical protein